MQMLGQELPKEQVVEEDPGLVMISSKTAAFLIPEISPTSSEQEEIEAREAEEEYQELATAGYGLIVVAEGGTPEIRMAANQEDMCRQLQQLEGFEGAVIPFAGSIFSFTKIMNELGRALIFPGDNRYIWVDDCPEDTEIPDDFEMQDDWYLGQYRYRDLNIRRATHEEYYPDVIPVDISEYTEAHDDAIPESEDPDSMY